MVVTVGSAGSQKKRHSKNCKGHRKNAEEQKGAERALSEEEKTAASVAVVLQKKKQVKKANEHRENVVDIEEQKETEWTLMEEEDQRKEETDFCRVWRDPIEFLEKVKGKRNLAVLGPRCPLPWMQSIRETKYDFSKLEENEIKVQIYKFVLLQVPLKPPTQVPKKMLNVSTI